MRKVKQPLDLTFRRVDPKVVAAIKSTAKMERISRNHLLREMVKAYQEKQDRKDDQEILRVFEDVRQQEAVSPTSSEDLRRESDQLMAYGAQQARKLGIKPRDVNRHIRELRETRL